MSIPAAVKQRKVEIRHSALAAEEIATFYSNHPHGDLVASAVSLMRRMKSLKEPTSIILPEFNRVLSKIEPEIWRHRSPDSPEYKFWVELVDLKIRVIELKDKYVKEMEQGHIEGHTPTKVTAEETAKRRWGFLKKTSKVKSKSDCGDEKRTSLLRLKDIFVRNRRPSTDKNSFNGFIHRFTF
uniref:Translationally-controlled tumor n=1 Tax=Anthurium amnicola TaxID=1678845 RepID=A0A1D1XN95_9ARAE